MEGADGMGMRMNDKTTRRIDTRHRRHIAVALGLMLALALATGGTALAGNGDCGQPVSSGTTPVASDCLIILNASVGLATCNPQCICLLKGIAPVSATDALICLNVAVGNPPSNFPNCPCAAGSTSAARTGGAAAAAFAAAYIATGYPLAVLLSMGFRRVTAVPVA
jgi:hypothetical protein